MGIIWPRVYLAQMAISLPVGFAKRMCVVPETAMAAYAPKA